MNKFCIVWVFLMALAVNAQFKVSGEINNYANQDIMVRIFNGPTDILINKVTTDKNGKFSVNIPQKFSGIVRLTDTSKQAVLDLLSDNENVNFKATYQNHSFSNLDVKEGKSAQGFQQYLSFEGFNDMKANIFPVIKSLYGENDEFHKASQKEEQGSESFSPSSDSPSRQSYNAISSVANTQCDGQMAAEIHKDKIEKRLLKDNNYLERTGFMSKLVLD